MSSRWCGVTSAVTSMPCALAQRITSTEPAVETCATCTRLLVCRASITSRATMVSSAMPGQPGSPSRPESSPSWQQAVGPARSGSWECWEMTPPKAPDVLQRPPHHPRVVHAPAVVGEHPHLGPGPRHQAELRELLAAEAAGHRTDRLYVDQPGRPAEVEDPLRRLARVGDRRGVRHRQHRGEATESSGPRAGEHRLGVLAARLAQVGVQVDQPREGDEAVGVDHLGACVALRGRAPRSRRTGRLSLRTEERGSLDDQRS